MDVAGPSWRPITASTSTSGGPPIAVKLGITVKAVEKNEALALGLAGLLSEYEIETESSGVKVVRNYKDFDNLNAYYIEKFPYRMVPVLPPLPLLPQSSLLQTHHGLQTYLTVIASHPILGKSPILNVFLTDASPDYRERLKDAFKDQVNEYGHLDENAEADLPDDEDPTSKRVELRNINGYLTKLGRLFNEQADRSEEQQNSLEEVGENFDRRKLKKALKDSTTELANISQTINDVASQVGRFTKVQRSTVNKQIDALIGLLDAHDNLCERLDGGIFKEMRHAFEATSLQCRLSLTETLIKPHPFLPYHKAHTLVGSDPAELARKAGFAVQCCISETAFVERFLPNLPNILLAYAKEAAQHHDKMSKIWHRLDANETASKN